jgi:3-oxoacyl-[acyl-carrier protein] reductase
MLLNKISEKLKYNKYLPLSLSDELMNAYSGSSICGNALRGKKVLISGATGGIGSALAQRFLDEHCQVILLGRNEEKLIYTVENLRQQNKDGVIQHLCCDLLDSEGLANAVEKVFADLGVIDIFICNAGVLFDEDKNGIFRDNNKFLSSWSLNFEANTYLCELIVQKMHDFKIHGTIAIISSICALHKRMNYTGYGVSKASIGRYGALLRSEHDDIDILTIYPGGVATGMLSFSKNQNISCGINSLNRMIIPEEIAADIAFICSDIGRYITQGITASANEMEN